MHIALKENGETIYWLKLFQKSNLIDTRVNAFLDSTEEIKRILISSLNTAKKQ